MTYKGEHELAGVHFTPGYTSHKKKKKKVHKYIFSLDVFHMSTSHIHRFRVMDGVAVQHFTFVLTDLEGCQRFGFCRLTKSTHTCLCILRYVCKGVS